MPKLEAVVEGIYELDEFPWPQAKCLAPDYMWVHPAMSDEEIGFVIGQFITCEVLHKRLDARSMLQTILKADELILRGGLRVIDEKNGLVINPGCCCGLENWNEWLDVPFGKCEIWTGHDPESLIELNDGKIKIWQDRSLKNEVESIEFTVDELIKGLKNVKKDLTDFLHRLGQWTKFIKPGLENQVVSHFAKSMNIK